MSKKQIGWIITAFFIALLLSLLVNMPARQLLRVVKLPPRLHIAGLSGSITKARIERLTYRQFSLRQLQLRWQPGCLFQLAICYRASSSDQRLLANVRLQPITGVVSLQHSRIGLSATLLHDVSTLLIKPRGRFDIVVDQLDAHQGKLKQVAGHIVWHQAGIEGEDQSLGDYQAQFTSAEDGLHITLADQQGLIKLHGELLLSWNGEYRADATLAARPGLKPSIKNALGLMTRKTGLNRYQIHRKGRLNGQQMALLNRLYAIPAP